MVVVVAIMHAKNAIYLAEVNYAKSLREEKTVVNWLVVIVVKPWSVLVLGLLYMLIEGLEINWLKLA